MGTLPLYRPPTRVVTSEIPWLSVVTRIDPNWAHDRHYEIQYQFTNRNKYCNPDQDGPYSPYRVLWQQGLPNLLTPPTDPPAPGGSFNSDFSRDFF